MFALRDPYLAMLVMGRGAEATERRRGWGAELTHHHVAAVIRMSKSGRATGRSGMIFYGFYVGKSRAGGDGFTNESPAQRCERRGVCQLPLARLLQEQAVDETLDVAGVDEAVAVGVAGARIARRCAIEENVDEELDV